MPTGLLQGTDEFQVKKQFSWENQTQATMNLRTRTVMTSMQNCESERNLIGFI